MLCNLESKSYFGVFDQIIEAFWVPIPCIDEHLRSGAVLIAFQNSTCWLGEDFAGKKYVALIFFAIQIKGLI